MLTSQDMLTNRSNSPPRFPWVTLTIIILCTSIKLFHSALSPLSQNVLVTMGGTLPSDVAGVFGARDITWTDQRLLSLFSALFIHAGWLHLLGNMVYLWVFGIPVERRLGWFGMLFVFLSGGALAHLFVSLRLPELSTPIIGASGAVSAIVGAYLVLFPAGRIGLLLPLGLYLQFTRVPAVLVIGSWFTLQLVYTVFGPITGIVAWWTHMAGFTLGLIFALLARAAAQTRLG